MSLLQYVKSTHTIFMTIVQCLFEAGPLRDFISFNVYIELDLLTAVNKARDKKETLLFVQEQCFITNEKTIKMKFSASICSFIPRNSYLSLFTYF